MFSKLPHFCMRFQSKFKDNAASFFLNLNWFLQSTILKFHRVWSRFLHLKHIYPANSHLFKVTNKNTRKKVWNMLKFNNKNTRTTSFLLLTLNIFHTFSRVSVVDIEQVNVSYLLAFYPFQANVSFLYPLKASESLRR